MKFASRKSVDKMYTVYWKRIPNKGKSSDLTSVAARLATFLLVPEPMAEMEPTVT